MKGLIPYTLVGMVLFACSMTAMAVTMDITASYMPSMSDPDNDVFTDTTPQSGHCVTWPQQCTGGEHSLATGLTLLPSKGLTPQDEKRESLFFKWPSSFRNVVVTNEQTGKTQTLQFRVASLSGRQHAVNKIEAYNWGQGNAAFNRYPFGGCNSIGMSKLSEIWLAWLWSIPIGNDGCYNITSVERPVGAPNFIYKVDELSFGYELKVPDPLKVEAGVYTGSLSFTIGPGNDIDFGDNFSASDSNLTLNFTLSVDHELKLTPAADSYNVSLQPCTSGRVCTEDEGTANWERWMVTRITPRLTGRSNFSLSSSGSFMVYLECELQSGPDCALKSDNTPSRMVPIRTLLTLPNNIVDNLTGSSVSKRRLAVGRDTSNFFVTKSFNQDSRGSIDFLIDQKVVDTMLITRPDTYRGAVTVIFDPEIG